MQVAIRADASPTIGTGHVKRCLSLAAALREAGAEVCLVVRALGVDTRRLAHEAGLLYVELAPPVAGETAADGVPHAAWAGVGWRDDAAQTVQRLMDRGWHPQWLVVDHYAFDARWHRHVGQALSARIAVIDDLADRDLACDLLVDHNLAGTAADKYADRLAAGARRLAGPRFALLGPAYANVRPIEMRPTVRSIGIFMGGVDAAGLSALALRACREAAGFAGRIEVATTRSNPHLDALHALAGQWPGTVVTLDQADLADFHSRHDLQVGAGGGAVWERCRLGVPTLAVIAAANQQAVLPALAALGGVATVGSADAAPSVEELGRAVRTLVDDLPRRRALGERSRALVDGLGARRVALAMAAPSLTVRLATADDALTMHRWRNDAATRTVSGDDAEIALEDHLRWVTRSLADAGRCLLVGRVGTLDVGVIRFDAAADGASVVSLYLDPTLHGLGLGQWLLRAGEQAVCARAPHAPHFVAHVLPSNRASQRMFEACGYALQDGRWHKPARAVANDEQVNR